MSVSKPEPKKTDPLRDANHKWVNLLASLQGANGSMSNQEFHFPRAWVGSASVVKEFEVFCRKADLKEAIVLEDRDAYTTSRLYREKQDETTKKRQAWIDALLAYMAHLQSFADFLTRLGVEDPARHSVHYLHYDDALAEARAAEKDVPAPLRVRVHPQVDEAANTPQVPAKSLGVMGLRQAKIYTQAGSRSAF